MEGSCQISRDAGLCRAPFQSSFSESPACNSLRAFRQNVAESSPPLPGQKKNVVVDHPIAELDGARDDVLERAAQVCRKDDVYDVLATRCPRR